MGIGDGGIEGNPSDSKTFTTRVPKPNKVTNIQIEDMSPTSVLLRWDKDAGDTWYIVSYRKQGTGEWTTQTVHDNVISISGLLPSTLYEFKVTGRNEFASGEDSDITVHKTKEDKPSAPSAPIATEIKRDSVLLSWDRGSADVLKYLVEYRVLGSTGEWTTISSLINERRLLGLDHSKSYEARITSVNACCRSDPSSSVIFTTLTPPPDPPLLEGEGGGGIYGQWCMGGNGVRQIMRLCAKNFIQGLF